MNTHIATHTHGPARARGFTIIELMVTCAVAGVLTAMAVPAFNNFVLDDRDVGQINSLVASFNFARSEAVKQNVPGGIIVCPSANGQNCNGAGNWQLGWIVQVVSTNQVLQSVPALNPSTTVTPTGPAAQNITFLSSGMVQNAAGLSTFTVCDTRGAAYAHEVEVSITGRVVASPTRGKSVNGANLACP